jgi:hypothetical protein
VKHHVNSGLFTRSSTLGVLAIIALMGCPTAHHPSSTEFVRYGGMHEAIGQQQHHGRVALVEVLDQPHFYGVGAVEGLQGEITILDSEAVVTGAAPDGRLDSLPSAVLQATMLAGRSVPEWTSVTLDEAVPNDRLDERIAAAAEAAGLNPDGPFVFMVDGALTDVRVHVINGACPVHARMKNLTLSEKVRPFELEAKSLAGMTVGVYAKGSVGQLTHPATNTHAHLIWEDDLTGRRVTGHLERFGLAPGADLKLPAE